MEKILENAFVIVCEDEMEISTKQLFDLYDQKRGVLFHTPDGDVYIAPGCYLYKTKINLSYMFDNIYEYDIAVFEREFKLNLLTEWELKLLELFHIEWFNELHKMLNSSIFVNILKQIATLRLTQSVTPEKSLMFKPFKCPILDTVIPPSITDGHSTLWEPFLSECSQIQIKHILSYDSSRS